MTVRPAEAHVVKFLRAALRERARAVNKLEVRPRGAGLLGEGQRITHAKVFKKAKKSLGIRSVRNGFGDAGEWLWRLERRPASPVSKTVSIADIYAEGLDPEDVAFLPVGSTGSRASTTIAHSPTSHRTDGASF